VQADNAAVIDGDLIYRVKLCGQVVECLTLRDAAAVKTADDILRGDDPTPYRREQLEPWADVLLQYGQRQAARTLVDRSAPA
jgi:hypothetical protein